MDPALFSLNWFLCLFVDTLPVGTYLHIWDAFLFEGSKVSLSITLNMIWRVVLESSFACFSPFTFRSYEDCFKGSLPVCPGYSQNCGGKTNQTERLHDAVQHF